MSTTLGGGDQVNAEREMKHEELLNAINNLEDVKRHAYSLFEKIKGPEPPSDKAQIEAEKGIPTLSHTLVRAPKDINRLAENIRTILNSIDEILF